MLGVDTFQRFFDERRGDQSEMFDFEESLTAPTVLKWGEVDLLLKVSPLASSFPFPFSTQSEELQSSPLPSPPFSPLKQFATFDEVLHLRDRAILLVPIEVWRE
jgi:hypothetical protein